MGASNTHELVSNNLIVVEREMLLKAHPVDDDLKHWHIWSQLDMHDEATAVRLSKFMNDLIHLVVPDASIRDSEMAMSGCEMDLSSVKLHDAIHMEWPPSTTQVEEMMRDFRHSADAVHIPLPRDIYHKFLVHAAEHYATQPNVIKLQIPPGCTLTVVGDLHGQLHDLLHIFDTQGLPSPTCWYLFNGDHRGTCSLEICAILFAYHMLYPDAIHINRGNHEDEFMNSVHSFRREVLVKYDADMCEAFNAVFDALPLAHVVNDSLFVVHGGLSETPLTIDQINSIPRYKYHLHAPHDPTMPKELHWMQDLLWSDPQVSLGLASSRRGAGVVFGPDICADFLQRNQLKMVVRSHEVVRQGFMWAFDLDEVSTDGCIPAMPPAQIPTDLGNVPENMLLTLFSCSNYCHDTNRGGILKVDADLRYHIVNYSISPARPTTRGLPAFRSIEDRNRHNIIHLIASHKSKLAQAFEALHPVQTCRTDQGTRITVDAWAQVLRKVLALDLDWKELAPHMTTVDADGNVDCDEFLSSFCAVYEGVRGPVSTSVCEPHARGQQPEWRGVFDALYPHRKALEAIFCFFDRDHSGAISMDEFKQGCLLLNEHLPLSDRWKDPIALFRDMDIDGTRAISINKFFEAFRIVDSLVHVSSTP
ncbi:hypothetical protein, variant 1 [Aphanomyces invadans]|uniref:Serine/threonine-protein phosphatase n=1 Tax=Aphanomyces invadans TaxID=157072 RepID=A0A024UUS7_9STRA|nr:hypothetical protein, variant 1 [Aphanomyces invadans]ETW10099.1 hypothetical protein, variant 1 [Aphanomyces invadans]|eukprot:XP_008861513.1 hypothetical protein, variant 1 [Aphanomyces invadans]